MSLPTESSSHTSEPMSAVAMVVPVFNEVDRWNRARWEEFLQLEGVKWLFVNDGSTDSTQELLSELSRDRANVEVLHSPVNQGKGETVRSGMKHFLDDGVGGYVGFMDADGAFRAEDLRNLIMCSSEERTRGPFDAIWSSRVGLAGHDIERRQTRHYLGRVISTLLGVVVTDMPYDSQSGLKLFRVCSEFQRCLQSPFATRWLFDVEIIVRWRKLNGRGIRLLEVPLWSWTEVGGSKIRGRELFRVTGDIARILWEAGGTRGAER